MADANRLSQPVAQTIIYDRLAGSAGGSHDTCCVAGAAGKPNTDTSKYWATGWLAQPVDLATGRGAMAAAVIVFFHCVVHGLYYDGGSIVETPYY